MKVSIRQKHATNRRCQADKTITMDVKHPLKRCKLLALFLTVYCLPLGLKTRSGCLIFLSIVFASCNSNSVRVNEQFSIGYLEMYNSISLSTENQSFVSDVREAYWNNDSLVVYGEGGCYLLRLKTIEYNDEMIKIDCGNAFYDKERED